MAASGIAKEAMNLFLKELKGKGPDFAEKAWKALQQRMQVEQLKQRRMTSTPEPRIIVRERNPRNLPRLDYAELARTGVKKTKMRVSLSPVSTPKSPAPNTPNTPNATPRSLKSPKVTRATKATKVSTVMLFGSSKHSKSGRKSGRKSRRKSRRKVGKK